MATKKPAKKSKGRASSSGTGRRRSSRSKGPILSPDVKRDIAVVFLIAMAALSLFGCFNSGGALVTGTFHAFRLVLGYAAYLLPLVFTLLAWMLFQSERY